MTVSEMMRGVDDWMSIIEVCRVEIEGWEMIEGVISNRVSPISAGHQTEPTILTPSSHSARPESGEASESRAVGRSVWVRFCSINPRSLSA